MSIPITPRPRPVCSVRTGQWRSSSRPRPPFQCVTPGIIETTQSSDPVDSLGPDGLVDAGEDIPFGRVGTAAEVAAAVRFLLSGESGYITGQALTVDGELTTYMKGWTMGALEARRTHRGWRERDRQGHCGSVHHRRRCGGDRRPRRRSDAPGRRRTRSGHCHPARRHRRDVGATDARRLARRSAESTFW